MKKISKDTRNYVLSKDLEPVAHLELPAALCFETIDAFGDQVQSEKDTLKDLDFERVNPATGPVFFNGIGPGDTLAVHIKSIQVASQGSMTCTPGSGVLHDQYSEASTRMVSIENGKCRFLDIDLPLKPMIGVIGLAPENEPVPCGTPGDHGGNMDTTLICEGSTLYLPVFVEGGLLSMGDLHAAMGDGEICVTGVEVGGEVVVEVQKVEGLSINCPLVLTDDKLAFIGSKENLEKAIYQAVDAMAKFITEESNLSFNDVTMLMSAAGNTEISQVVDPMVTARFSMPLSVLRQIKGDWFF